MSNFDKRPDFSIHLLVETRMTRDDIEAIMGIEQFSFNPPWSPAMFTEELSNRHSVCLTFRYQEVITSFVCFWMILDEAHLLNIAVNPTYRRLGIATHILNRVEQICRCNDVGRIILDVARRNQSARALYKKSGFSSIGFRKRYYPAIDDDAVVMEKWLGKNLY